MRWRIQLFGTVTAHRGDRTEDRFSTKKNAELLGYLAISPGSQFSRKHLCGILWPQADDIDAARVRLRQAISSIRRQLEPPGIEAGSVLVTERDLVWLNRELVESDAAKLEIAFNLAKSSPPNRLKEILREILDLHQGEFMTGISAEWISIAQEGYHEKFVAAADRLIDLCLTEGDWSKAAQALKQTIAADPYDEDRHCKLMRAYRYLGRLSQAIGLYEEFSLRIKRDLGEAPSGDIRRLAESIQNEMASGAYRHSGSATQEEAPERHARPHPFPAPSTRFYGRELEVSTLRNLMSDPKTRLVTLLGPGGVGKTRLALEFAERWFFDHSGSIWFVPLVDLSSRQEIESAVVSALGAEFQKGASPADLAAWQLDSAEDPILILDNFDHLVEQGAGFIRELLDRLPNLTCLVTSRQPLELAGEHHFRIQLLDLPPKTAETPGELLEYSSVQLFLDRAKLVKPDFQITGGNAASVAELCERLEGIPLAIEICAALIQTIRPAQMVVGLNKRFELLISRRRDISPRHRSLRAAVEYSYRMLSPDLAYIFRKLSIFGGGWTVESAEAILGTPNVHEALAQLQERSLVTTEEVWVGRHFTMRFHMLETFREFGWEMLSNEEQEQLAQAHQAFFSEFARTQRLLYFNNEANADELQIEQGNLYAAIRWCLADRRLADAVALSFNLYQFWAVKERHEEGVHWLQTLIDDAEFEFVPLDLRCACARAMYHLCANVGEEHRTGVALDRYVSLAQESGDRDIVHALSCQGNFYGRCGDTDRAIGLCEEALQKARLLGEPQTGSVLRDLSEIHFSAGRYEKAIEYAAEAYPISVKTGYQMNVVETLHDWASSLAIIGRYEEGRNKFEEAIAAAEKISSPRILLFCRLGRANCLLLEDRIEEAGEEMAAAVSSRGFDLSSGELRAVLQAASAFALNRGDLELSVRLAAAAQNQSIRPGSSLNRLAETLMPNYETCRERLREAYDRAWTQGLLMNQAESRRLALETVDTAGRLQKSVQAK